MYFEDLEYQRFLKERKRLVENKDEFQKIFIEINQEKNKRKLLRK